MRRRIARIALTIVGIAAALSLTVLLNSVCPLSQTIDKAKQIIEQTATDPAKVSEKTVKICPAQNSAACQQIVTSFTAVVVILAVGPIIWSVNNN